MSPEITQKEPRHTREILNELSESRGINPSDVHNFLAYEPQILSGGEKAAVVSTGAGVAVALGVGSLFAAYPEVLEGIRMQFPRELVPRLHDMFNYWHSVHSSTVDTPHLASHLPDLGFDVALFAPLFGVGARITNKIGWRGMMPRFQEAVRKLTEQGHFEETDPLPLAWKMGPRYTALIVGTGDLLANEFVRRRAPNDALLMATQKQEGSDIWVKLADNASQAELRRAFRTADFRNSGEIIIMPVRASDMVFPPSEAYDISPDSLDILIGNIRAVENHDYNGQPPRPIIIVGDKKQKITTHAHDPSGAPIDGEGTEISLESIRDKYPSVQIIDPTELVLERIMHLADGARIAFRGSDDAVERYLPHFKARLDEANYEITKPDEIFQMGYNIADDPTVADPRNSVAVILTADARDKLLENGFPSEQILFVPDMVIAAMESASNLDEKSVE